LIYPDRPDLVRLALGRLLLLRMHECVSMQRRERVRVEGRSAPPSDESRREGVRC
jgi:hypothetical protein